MPLNIRPCAGCGTDTARPGKYCTLCQRRLMRAGAAFDKDKWNTTDVCTACDHPRFRHHYGTGSSCRGLGCACLQFIGPKPVVSSASTIINARAKALAEKMDRDIVEAAAAGVEPEYLDTYIRQVHDETMVTSPLTFDREARLSAAYTFAEDAKRADKAVKAAITHHVYGGGDVGDPLAGLTKEEAQAAISRRFAKLQDDSEEFAAHQTEFDVVKALEAKVLARGPAGSIVGVDSIKVPIITLTTLQRLRRQWRKLMGHTS